MNEVRYDNHFNMNEWFIIIALLVGTMMVLWLPRRFPKKTVGIYLICGVFWGFIYDHTLGVFPVSYYNINDSSRLEVMDFFSHLMYAPFSYLFFYLYDLIRNKPRILLLFVLVWAFVSAGFERLCVAVGIFHYQYGFSTYYSFAIYLVVLSFWVIMYHALRVYGDYGF